MIKRQP